LLLEFIKSDGKLIPSSDDTFERLKKMPVGESVFVEYKPRRNYQNHKRFFSMLNQVMECQSHYKEIDNLLDVIKLRVGHFKTFVSHRGDAMYIPKSIDFYSLNEQEFRDFFSKAIDICMEIVGDENMERILRYV